MKYPLLLNNYNHLYVLYFVGYLAIAIASIASSVKLYLGVYFPWMIVCLFCFYCAGSALKEKGFMSALSYFYGRLVRHKLYYSFWMLFCFSIVLSSFLNGWLGIYNILKYVALIVALHFFVNFPISIESFNKILAIVAISSLAVLTACAGLYPEYLDRSTGRVGWIWMPAGVLWKAGIYLIPMLLWALIEKKNKMANGCLLFVCLVLIAADGSRTGALVFVVSIILVPLVYSMLHGFKGTTVIVIGGVLLLAILIRSVIFGVINSGSEVQVRGGDDNLRVQMLRDAWAGAQLNFPFGGGFGSTTTQLVDMESPMVVHMTYLQVLADLGLVGLVAYVLILGYPLYLFFRIVRITGRTAVGVLVLPSSIISIYVFSGLFHPISNEISEWFVVIFSIALIMNEYDRVKTSK